MSSPVICKECEKQFIANANTKYDTCSPSCRSKVTDKLLYKALEALKEIKNQVGDYPYKSMDDLELLKFIDESLEDIKREFK